MSVGYYFDKRRSFAIGIAVCGTGVGTFILSPLNRKLTSMYGWEGAFLIKAAFVLNGCVCGAVMRPVPIEPSELLKQEKRLQKSRAALKLDRTQTTQEKSENQNFLAVADTTQTNTHSKRSLYVSEPNNIDKNSSSFTKIGKSLEHIENGNMSSSRKQVSSIKTINLSINMLAQCKSLQHIPIEAAETADESSKQPNSFFQKLNKIIDLSIFMDFIFVFFGVSNFFTSLGFNAPFIYIVDQATNVNIAPSDADWLLSTIGISNTVGRIVLGLIADMKGVNRLYLYSTVLTICGIATMIEPFFQSFTGFMIYSIVFGFTSGNHFFFIISSIKV